MSIELTPSEAVIEAYRKAYFKVYNKTIQVDYWRGWYSVYSNNIQSKYRKKDIEEMTANLIDRFNNMVTAA